MVKFKVNSESNDTTTHYFFENYYDFFRSPKNSDKPYILIVKGQTRIITFVNKEGKLFNPNNRFITEAYLSTFDFHKVSETLQFPDVLPLKVTVKRLSYKLSSILTKVKEEPFFTNDGEAWNYLSEIAGNKYMTLEKYEEILVPINDAKNYIESYNAKYDPKLAENQTSIKLNYWLPVLIGITNKKYNINTAKKLYFQIIWKNQAKKYHEKMFEFENQKHFDNWYSAWTKKGNEITGVYSCSENGELLDEESKKKENNNDN